MSDLEVLSNVIGRLDSISVPVQYTEQITIPLINANNMLKQLYKAIVDQLKKKEEEQPEVTEDDIQIGNVEVVNEIPQDAEELN